MKKIVYVSMLVSLLYSQEYGCLASGAREYYNYDLKEHNKIVYRGQTNGPHDRMLEHYRDGKRFTHMVIKGNAKTLKGALKQERNSLATYRKSHEGNNPKYNKKKNG